MEEIVIFLTELDKFVMLSCLLVPMTGILVLTLLNQLRKSGSKRLLILYGAMLTTSLVSARFGPLAGLLIGTLTGMFAGIFICPSPPDEANISLILAGVFIGALVSNGADFFSAYLGLAGAYFIFIVCTCIISFLFSFLLAKLVGKIKGEYLKVQLAE